MIASDRWHDGEGNGQQHLLNPQSISCAVDICLCLSHGGVMGVTMSSCANLLQSWDRADHFLNRAPIQDHRAVSRY
jgi:hypothetical protein